MEVILQIHPCYACSIMPVIGIGTTVTQAISHYGVANLRLIAFPCRGCCSCGNQAKSVCPTVKIIGASILTFHSDWKEGN